MTFLLIVCSQLLQAQGSQIKGKVTSSEDGNPLPGASVVVKGTNVVTITDAEGNYTLNAPQSANSIIVSFMGMQTQEVKIEGQALINVVLQPSVTGLEEVVVTAIGITREKKALGYSVQAVSGDNISNARQPNIINALDGKVAGVQITNSAGVVGASSYITIRGVNSITLNSQPLFVVDGVPIDNSMIYSGNPDNSSNNLVEGTAYNNRASDLNPDDIESIDVLKGGAATALYGLQAANGVVMITTKKGAAGKGNAFSVSFNSSVEIDQVSQMPKMQTKYAAGSNGKWIGPDVGTNKSWGPLLDTMRFDGSIYPWDKNGQLVTAKQKPGGKKAIAYDNVGKFFQNGISYNNNFSLQGGNQSSNFFMSYSNLTSSGIVPNNTYDKNTLKVSGESNLTSKLKISGSAMYVNTDGNSIQQGSNLSGVMLGLLRAPVSFDLANGYSNAADQPKAYMFADGTPRTYISAYDNPYWTVNENKFKTNVDRFIGSYNLTFSALDWLIFNYRFGNDVYVDRRFGYYAIYSQGGDDPGLGSVQNDYHFNSILNSDFTINIKRDLTSDIKSNLLLGQNMYQAYGQQVYMEGNGLNIPNFYQISNTSSQLTRENQSKKRTAALYGDLSLSFKDMLFLDATFRREWSTTLGADNLAFNFPSISCSFIFTELAGLKNDMLTLGKLRASYAQTANDAPEYYTRYYYTLATYNDGWTNNGIAFPWTNGIGQNINSFVTQGILGNSKIAPERTNSIEVGADLNFWKKFNLGFTYYNNQNKDQIILVPLAGSSGYVSGLMNIGKMENKGVEISANFIPVKTKDFDWDFTINFSKNVNKVIALAPNVDAIQLNGFTGITIEAVANKPFGEIFANSFIKDSKGKLVINDDPTDPGYGYPIKSDIQVPLGSYLPNWIGSFTNNLSFMGLGLTFLIEVKNGGLMWNGTLSRLNGFGTSQVTEDRGTTATFSGVKGHLDVDNNLVSSGAANDIPAKKSQYYYSTIGGGASPAQDQFVQKTDWVRLRDITLSYTLDSKMLSGVKIIKSLSIYATGKNLFLNTPYTGVDPETSLTGATSSQGLDYFNMPGSKGYTFGLKVIF